jgi:CRP/FNR family transcriptional regulator, cyclic AMP receptor protein
MADGKTLVMLEQFTADQWETFTAYAERIDVSVHDTIIMQGQADRALYVVLAGRSRVTVHNTAVEVFIDEIGPGELFGELSFFDGCPRTASVRASTPSTLMRLTREAFDRMNARDPRLGAALLLELGRVLALRFRHATKHRTQAPPR